MLLVLFVAVLLAGYYEMERPRVRADQPVRAPLSLVLDEPSPAKPSDDGWYEGWEGLEYAAQRALGEEKLVTVYVYTDWCAACKQIDRKLLSERTVESCLRRTERVRVNPEHSPADRDVAFMFRVTSYPSLFFFDPATREYWKLPISVDSLLGQRLLTPEEFVTHVCEARLG